MTTSAQIVMSPTHMISVASSLTAPIMTASNIEGPVDGSLPGCFNLHTLASTAVHPSLASLHLYCPRAASVRFCFCSAPCNNSQQGTRALIQGSWRSRYASANRLRSRSDRWPWGGGTVDPGGRPNRVSDPWYAPPGLTVGVGVSK
eukprot:scaffold2641_cov380-Prasinococcus_capsulatus_cf.AAC.2